MIKKTFKIKWRNPETDRIEEVVKEFSGDDQFPPHEWAQDYAYTLADKGWYSVEEVKL